MNPYFSIFEKLKNMEKYTEKEIKTLMDSVSFPRGLSITQTLKVVYWSLFEKNKLQVFCEGIEKGKSLHFALNDACK